MEQEIRYCTGVEIRAKGANKIQGYAAVFNQPSLDLGGFTEVVLPGAFARAIRSRQSVGFYLNHNKNQVLASTDERTLKLSEDTTGLDFECVLSDDPLARMVHSAVARGDVRQCSFGFVAQKEHWVKDSGRSLRQLADVDLFDVSALTVQAAYPQTSLTVRSLWPAGIPAEVRSHRLNDSPLDSACYRFKPVDQALEDRRRIARVRLASLQD